MEGVAYQAGIPVSWLQPGSFASPATSRMPPPLSASYALNFFDINAIRCHSARAKLRQQEWMLNGHFSGPEPTNPTGTEEATLIASGCYQDHVGHWRPPPCRDASRPPKSDLCGHTMFPFSRQGDRIISDQGFPTAARLLWTRIDALFFDALYDATAGLIACWAARSMQAAFPSSPPSCESPTRTEHTPDAPTLPLALCTPPPQPHYMQIPEIDLIPAARVSRAPLFTDQEDALLIVAITDARALLAALSRADAVREQAPQVLLSLTNWRLNRDLPDAGLLQFMAALTVIAGEQRRQQQRQQHQYQELQLQELQHHQQQQRQLQQQAQAQEYLQLQTHLMGLTKQMGIQFRQQGQQEQEEQGQEHRRQLTHLCEQGCQQLREMTQEHQQQQRQLHEQQLQPAHVTMAPAGSSSAALTQVQQPAHRTPAGSSSATLLQVHQPAHSTRTPPDSVSAAQTHVKQPAQPAQVHSLSTSTPLTITSAIFVKQASSSRKDPQLLSLSPSSLSTSFPLKVAGRHAAPLNGPITKERYLTRIPLDISAPAFWALGLGTQVTSQSSTTHIHGASSSISLLPECCKEWLFGSPDDYYFASAHRKQQHRQRLQDYKKRKQLEFSLLYPPRRKLKPRLGPRVRELTPQDANTDANIQALIAKAIKRAERLIDNHESYKALCASVKPCPLPSEQPTGSPGHHYREPLIRLPQDQKDSQYAVFDPMD
jgi:hypothetical protein